MTDGKITNCFEAPPYTFPMLARPFPNVQEYCHLGETLPKSGSKIPNHIGLKDSRGLLRETYLDMYESVGPAQNSSPVDYLFMLQMVKKQPETSHRILQDESFFVGRCAIIRLQSEETPNHASKFCARTKGTREETHSIY